MPVLELCWTVRHAKITCSNTHSFQGQCLWLIVGFCPLVQKTVAILATAMFDSKLWKPLPQQHVPTSQFLAKGPQASDLHKRPI